MVGSVCGQARLDADTIALGDQTVLTISNAAQYPSAEMLSTGGVVALGQQFDTAGQTQRTLITCFEPGEHWIHIAEDDSLPLYVNDVAVDTTSEEIRDIAPIVRVPYTFWELFRWVLVIWAAAIVGILIWWLVDRKKRHGSIIVHHEPVDTRTPSERALQTLEELRRSQMWQSGKVKQYHTELTDAVRRFIEEETGIRATEMTSDETVETVSGQWPEVGGQLRDIFTTADLVKFAKSEPLPHEHEASLRKAVEFVKGFERKEDSDE